MRTRKSRSVTFILFFTSAAAMTVAACNTLVGIEAGTLGLCPDGTRVEDTGCENSKTSGSGGNGSSAPGASNASSASSGGGDNKPCVAPWQHRDPVGGRCYLQEYVAREWASAEQRCIDLGGHLVAIDSANELAFVAEWIASEVWIGGTDGGKEGTFVWTNGQPWTFASWKDGLPIDQGGNKDCVMLATSSGSLPAFDCRSCTEKRAYLCESLPDNP